MNGGLTVNFFTKLQHSQTTIDLLKDPNAFTLLAQIALRARRADDGYEITRDGTSVFLKRGQALIGDYESIGMTEKSYRCAKDRLIKRKLAFFVGANKGTIATLENTEVFDISMKKKAGKGRSKGD